jgi:A/G-specific adenine glycosylase
MSSDLSPIRRRLLAWFDRNRRDLPWRVDRDPYRIWVSEIMLQQTTVAAVAPRFERFLKSFPTLAHLAAASEQEVLREWEGLGYYRRARNLHAAARILAAQHSGEFPRDPEAWAELPGVGRYILGAVLSQAFDQRLPIIEANSQRVLCRLFAKSGDPANGPVKKWLWATAENLLPRKRAGDFNQALMELGALICTPSTPKCRQCPLSLQCRAFQSGRQESIPTRPAAEETVQVREVAVVIRKSDRVLLVQRPENGRWSKMWEFPRAEVNGGESSESAASRVAAELIGVRARIGSELMTIRHGVTRFRISLTCFDAQWLGGKFQSSYYPAGRWLRPAELNRYPVSSPQRKLATMIASAAPSRR